MDERYQKAVAWLSRDRLLHVDMLETLRTGESRLVAANDDGVLARMACGILLVSATSSEAAVALCRQAPAVRETLLHQEDHVPAFKEAFDLKFDMACVQVVRFDRAPMVYEGEVAVRPIGPERLDFVQRHYSAHAGRAYLQSRFAAGVMVGAFIGDELVGFAGEHEEGTLGLLEVLPAYRRRGVGKALAAYMVNRRLAQGGLPYGQVEVGNEVSLAMQRRLGYEISEQAVCWMHPRDRVE